MKRRALLLTLAIACAATAAAQTAPDDSTARLATTIAQSSGVRAGLCVHLDVTDGRLTAELSKHGAFVVHGLAATPEAAGQARRFIASRDLYGAVSVAQGPLSRLPYVDGLVNLVVVNDTPAALRNGLSLAEVMRVLRPNGVASLGGMKNAQRTLAQAGVTGFDVLSEDGDRSVIRKQRPPEMDDWTHWLHGPEGSNLSSDSLVGPADRLQWVDGPFWPLGATRAAIFAGGRSFTVMPKAKGPARSAWVLAARDAFNGLPLWERDVDTGGKPFDPRLLVAADGRVFTVLAKDGPAVALDAATGEVARTYDVGLSPRVILYQKGHMVLAAESEICSVNAESGAVRWRVRAGDGATFRDKALLDYSQYPHVVAGDGRLFAFITDAPEPPFTLVCCDLATGAEKWRKRQAGELLKYYQGVLALVSQPQPFSYSRKTLGTIRGVSAEDGRNLWEFADVPGLHADATVACSGGLFWVNSEGKGIVGLDPSTGAEKKRLKGTVTGHCGFVRTTERYFIGVYDTLTDRETGARLGSTFAFKNTCFLGNIPANGLLYNMPVYCGCTPYLRGTLAFAPAPAKAPPEKPGDPEERLVKGPAYGLAPPAAAVKDGWTAYRHDSRRSGGTSEELPRDLQVLWSARVNSQERTPCGKVLTPPVAAEGLVFVAAPDAHEVCALDAATGKPRWRFLLDGRVEVPPTIHGGLCLFGANDGWVYCLRAADGEEVWRFRAAPDDRRIMASGRLESLAPVPGVLVEDGVACFAAGRHSGLTGGILVYALEPYSGKVLWEKRLAVRGGNVSLKRDGPNWADMYHGNDLLVGDGRSLFLGRLAIDPKTGAMSISAKDARYLASGNARSGRGLFPFGFLYDRVDAAERLPKHYTPMRYQLTLWSYAGTEGLVVSFAGDRIFAVSGAKAKGSQYYTSEDWHLFAMSPVDEAQPRKDAEPLWSVKVPRGSVQALLPSGPVLFAAGPDKAAGGVLTAYSAADGSKLSEVPFGDAPIFDGLAAADGRLYVSTRGGSVFCLGSERPGR